MTYIDRTSEFTRTRDALVERAIAAHRRRNRTLESAGRHTVDAAPNTTESHPV